MASETVVLLTLMVARLDSGRTNPVSALPTYVSFVLLNLPHARRLAVDCVRTEVAV